METLIFDEKNGGVPKQLGLMQEFHSTLLHCDLVDLGYQGYRYTWRNGQSENAFMEECLDRVCVNPKWREMFPTAKVTHLTASYSDHDFIILVTEMAQMRHRRKKKLQCFEEKWVIHAECEEHI